MLEGSQIDQFISTTALVWASSIVLIMIGLVYFTKIKEKHDSFSKSHFLYVYILTLVLNIFEYVIYIIINENGFTKISEAPAYVSPVFRLYIFFGFLWNIAVIIYVLNYVKIKSRFSKYIYIFLILASALCCIFLGIDTSNEWSNNVLSLAGALNTVYNIFAVVSNFVLLCIIYKYRKKMPKSFFELCLLIFFLYVAIYIFVRLTHFTVKESVFIYSLLVLVLFNTTSNQDKETVNKLNINKDLLTTINNRRSNLINVVSSDLKNSLNEIVLYNDELYLSNNLNKELIQNDSKIMFDKTNYLINYFANVKDAFMLEFNDLPLNSKYQINMLTNDIKYRMTNLVNYKKTNFNIIINDKTFLNYIGDLYKIEKVIVNVLTKIINNSNVGENVSLSVSSKQIDSKNAEIIFVIQNTNQNVENINDNTSNNVKNIFDYSDLNMIISDRILEILNSKVDIKNENNNYIYTFSVLQELVNNELYKTN